MAKQYTVEKLREKVKQAERRIADLGPDAKMNVAIWTDLWHNERSLLYWQRRLAKAEREAKA